MHGNWMLRAGIMVLVMLFVALTTSYATADTGQNYFRFQLKVHDELNKLTHLISIDNVRGDTVWAYASNEELADFKTLGYSYEILPSPGSLIVPRMAANIQELITDWDTYPTYQQYLDLMSQFAAAYPDLCQIVNIGSTVQGRVLLFARVSANVNVEENEPEVMYSSTMHGDETTGYILMLRFIDYLLTYYGTDPVVTNILNSTEIWVNPLANPDGTYHGGNNTVNGAIRYNANSVDLNRNFPDPADGLHPDGRAWQSETIAMMDFFEQHDFVISANFHGGAEVVNYPWDTWQRRHADDAWFIHISRAYADTVHVHAISGYMTDLDNGITNGYDWYRVAGGRQDYNTYWMGGRETTIELSHTKLLPQAQLPAHWDYNWRSFLHYMQNALYGIRGTVTDAQTGLPLNATITTLNHDIDSSRVFTDPDVGDYHRMIAPGTYDLQFTSLGYEPLTVHDVNAAYGSITTVNVQLQPIPNTPILAFSGHDARRVDPGDTVSMHLTLVNNGGGHANDVHGVLSTADGYVSILQNTSTFPRIPALGGSGTSVYAYIFDVAPTCPSLHPAPFRLDVTAAGGYVDSFFFDIMIGQQIEDFESGGFASYPWQMGGNASWTISGTGPYEGNYCAKSGVITHGQSSQLYLQVNVATAGPISFYYKVSSESGYDFLRFYIDNVQQGQWSGEAGWTQASFDVAAGAHNLKWGYYKDVSVSRGGDCGWIDYIVFPPLAQPLVILTESVPDWTIDRPYSQQLEASGGFGPRIWSDFGGGLNGTGLTLSGAGLVSGLPIRTGPVNFNARVQDEYGGSAQRQYAFTINPSLTITTDSLPDGTVGMPYMQQLQASGGTGWRAWGDRDNDLNGRGFTISPSGFVSGTASAPESVSFTATVTDITGDSDERDLTFVIRPAGTYLPGDANGSGQTNGLDVTFLINYFQGGPTPPLQIECPSHGLFYPACDANGNCVVNGTDVVFMVNYFKGGLPLRYCPDCPPGGGLSPQDNPTDDAPRGSVR